MLTPASVNLTLKDYTSVTEMPGGRATAEQLSMLYTRYKMASHFSLGKDVLEVACGAGMGLGYLACTARRVLGGDYTARLLAQAKRHYHSRIPLVCLNAEEIPLRDASLDTVVLFEAIYYLAEPERFVRECKRILRPDGVVVVCSANKDWPGFSPSPLAKRYFSVPELYNLFHENGFRVEIFGAFPASPRSPTHKWVALIRKIAATFHLIPKTMRGKEWLKRLFYGPLMEIPPEITEGVTGLRELVPLPPDAPTSEFKVIYGVAFSEMRSGQAA